jgi:hypothetical protein
LPGLLAPVPFGTEQKMHGEGLSMHGLKEIDIETVDAFKRGPYWIIIFCVLRGKNRRKAYEFSIDPRVIGEDPLYSRKTYGSRPAAKRIARRAADALAIVMMEIE